MKATKQMNEGADVLLDDFSLLMAILVIAQALCPKFCGLKIFAHGFPSAKSANVCMHTVYNEIMILYTHTLLNIYSKILIIIIMITRISGLI